MGVPQFLAGLDLDPGVQQRLVGMTQDAPLTDDAGNPVAIGASSSTSAAPQYVKPSGPQPGMLNVDMSKTALGLSGGDMRIGTPAPSEQPQSSPRSEAPKTPAEARAGVKSWGGDADAEDTAVAAIGKPQGPAGPDGFPTYRDLSNPAGGGAAPAGPVHYTRAGWQNSARSESKQHTDYDPEALASSQEHRDVSAGQQMLAADKHLEAAQLQAKADVEYATAHARASADAQAEMAKIQLQREQYVQQEQAKMEHLALAAQKQVDPEAAKGSSGAQLMAAIGIAMGQYGASITGGQNAALQIVNANIDRNIRAQEANIANAGKAHDREQSLYHQSLEAFGDKERATLATKVAYLDQAKAMADQQYAIAKGSANEGQYHDLVAGISATRAKTAEDLARMTGVQVATQGSQHWQPAQAIGGGAGQKGKEKLFVPSLGGYARDEETARKLNAHGALRTQVNEDLHEIYTLLEDSKKLSSVTDYDQMQRNRQRIDELKHGVLQKTTVLADQGAMSNGDKAVAEARSGLESVDPQLKTDAQIKRMQAAISSVAKGHQRDARLEGESYGVQLGKENYVDTPNGPEARAQLAGRNKVVTKKTEGIDDLVAKPKGQPSE